MCRKHLSYLSYAFRASHQLDGEARQGDSGEEVSRGVTTSECQQGGKCRPQALVEKGEVPWSGVQADVDLDH